MIHNDSFYEELEHIFDQFLKYSMMILLGDFNPKIGTADIFRLTVGNKRLHEISNDNEVRVVNFATSKYVIIRRAIFPHCSIHKFTWLSPNG
jgi:hypothetical protein